MFDAVVIGAGVVGGLVARELSRYQLKVCLVERMNDVAMGATRANSAIVHAGFDAKEGSLKAELNVRGSVMMEKVAAELGVKYKKNGSLVVGFGDEDKKTLEELLKRGERNGVAGLRVIDREELLKIEPNIGDGVTCALDAPTGAIICPYELCLAAVGNAMDNGCELKLGFDVTGLKKTEGGWVVESEGESVEAKVVINCAGVYSDKIARMAGDDRFTVTPRRGEYMLLDKECGGTVSHTIFRCPSKMGKGILVSPTVDGNLLLGPTAVDIDCKEDTSTTPEGFDTIVKRAGDNVANLPLGKVITSFCGLRSVGSTGDFIIKSRDNVITLGGIESPGLSSAPAIAEYVEELLRESGMNAELKADFNPIRKPAHAFREMSLEEKNEVIKRDSRYGRIVCRCEGVTEGEIVEAIHQNPKATDVDGVKRRTRGGMGRCQGGFCSPIVVDILSRELGTSIENITKFGKNSVINYNKTKGDM